MTQPRTSCRHFQEVPLPAGRARQAAATRIQRASGLLIERCAEHFGEVEETRRRVAVATCRGRDEKIAETSKQRDVSTNLKRAVTRSPVSLALVLGMVVSAGGCSCGTVPLHIPSSTAITVPGHGIDIGRPLDPSEVFPTDVIGDALATELSQSLDTSGYPKDTVTSLKLTKMTLTVTDPEENGRALRGLGCLESLAFFIGDGDLREQAAYAKEGAFDGDPGPATYDMELTGKELAPALKAKDQLTVDAEVTPSEQPTFDTEVVFDFELTAEVDPLLVAQ